VALEVRFSDMADSGGRRWAISWRSSGGSDSNVRVDLERILKVILFFILVRMEVRDE
jgi:hypothetical protein